MTGNFFPTMLLISSAVIVLAFSQVKTIYPNWRAVNTNVIKSFQSE